MESEFELTNNIIPEVKNWANKLLHTVPCLFFLLVTRGKKFYHRQSVLTTTWEHVRTLLALVRTPFWLVRTVVLTKLFRFRDTWPEISNFEGGTILLKFSEKILVKEILLYLQKGRSCDFFILSGWNNFFRKVWDDLEPWFCARKWAGPGRIIKTYVKLISETGARVPLRAPTLYIRVKNCGTWVLIYHCPELLDG